MSRPNLSVADALGVTDPPAGEELGVELVESGITLEHVFRYVSQAAWACTPEVLVVLKDILSARVRGDKLSAHELEQALAGPSPMAPAANDMQAARARQPVRRSNGAVALLSIYGVIAPRASMVNSVSGPSGTGLDAFSSQLDAAVSDPEVSAIVVDINSPGGTVDMVPETAERIRNAREQKPIYGVANTDAGSAAYWLMSAMSDLAVTPSGMVGSIGVYSMHQDISGELEAQGRRNTLISAGKYKVEGNPFEALSEEARASIQSTVDGYYDWFVGDVAKGRGVRASVVRDGYGEGRMLMASHALEAGMVDKIATLEQVIGLALKGKPLSGAARADNDPSGTAPTLAGTEATDESSEIPVEHLQYLDM